MKTILATLALAGMMTAALAHSWYPLECCSERDCFPIKADDVKPVKGGWLLADGTFIAHGEARPSPDQDYHVCRFDDGKGNLIRMPGKPACFWAPMGAA